MIYKILFLFLPAFLLFVSPLNADVFQYFDQDGTLIITDDPYGLKKKERSKYKEPENKETKIYTDRKEEPESDFRYKDLTLKLIEDIAYEYYPVTGNNFKEVVQSIKTNVPRDREGKRNYAALTSWNFGWSYEMESSYSIEGSYIYVSLDLFDVELLSDIIVLLPGLTDDSEINNDDLERWEEFLQVLINHEHDHVNIVKKHLYSDDIIEKISGISELTLNYDPLLDIDSAIKATVKSETTKLGIELTKKINHENKEYDRLTKHGNNPEKRELFFGM